MGNTTEQLIKLLKASRVTVIKWKNGKAVKTYPHDRVIRLQRSDKMRQVEVEVGKKSEVMGQL